MRPGANRRDHAYLGGVEANFAAWASMRPGANRRDHV